MMYTPKTATAVRPILSMPVAVSSLGSNCVCTKFFCRGTSLLLSPAVEKPQWPGEYYSL